MKLPSVDCLPRILFQADEGSLFFKCPVIYLPLCPLVTWGFAPPSKMASAEPVSSLYRDVSQPPGCGPVPGPDINYTGPGEVLLEFVIS
jgi:hypothetical protein